MTDYANRLRGCVTASGGIDCRDPDLLLGAAAELDRLTPTKSLLTVDERRELIKRQAAEIDRLQAAKRRALAVADERSKEVVGLRAALVAVLAHEKQSAEFHGLGDCNCMNHSREAEQAYETGRCPHQLARALLVGLEQGGEGK